VRLLQNLNPAAEQRQIIDEKLNVLRTPLQTVQF
jgi:hypothetical protein